MQDDLLEFITIPQFIYMYDELDHGQLQVVHVLTDDGMVEVEDICIHIRHEVDDEVLISVYDETHYIIEGWLQVEVDHDDIIAALLFDDSDDEQLEVSDVATVHDGDVVLEVLKHDDEVLVDQHVVSVTDRSDSDDVNIIMFVVDEVDDEDDGMVDDHEDDTEWLEVDDLDMYIMLITV